MTCPRCGTVNASGRGTCTRCAGSLAPAAERDESAPPPVIPLTRRAELMQGSFNERVGRPSEAGPLYLLASERNTGQPAPPGTVPDAEPARAESGQRTDRLVPRLSPAP